MIALWVSARGKRARVRVFYKQRWLAIFRPFGGGAGLTIWRWIFLAGTDSQTLKHEAVHAEQFLRWGFWGFWWRYIPGAIWVLVTRRPVSDNPVEREAYDREREELI